MECLKPLFFRMRRCKTESVLFENSRPNAFPFGGKGSLLITRESAQAGRGALRWMTLQEAGRPKK
jgi:hypothetical protein